MAGAVLSAALLGPAAGFLRCVVLLLPPEPVPLDGATAFL